jgi:hypothetical protein
MTAPKKLVRKKKQAQSSSSSSSSRYMLLFVKVMIIVLILLWLAPLVSSKKKRSKRRKNRKRTLKSEVHKSRLDCEMECLDLIPEEAMNCIFECWSPACFEELYGENNDPLEPGEVDIERGQKMDECVQLELKMQRQEERARQRNGVTS